MLNPTLFPPQSLSLPKAELDPLPAHTNRRVLGMLMTLHLLSTEEGKEHFAIVTHRDPDADAIAAVLAMRLLVSEMVPNVKRISTYFDLSSASREQALARYSLDQRPTEQLVASLSESEEHQKTAIVLVDQPSLHSGIVLSPQGHLSPSTAFEADVIVDHHGEAPLFRDGVVISPPAWSTSALMLRALQIATASGLISDKWTRDTGLLNHLIVGAEIDAGISALEVGLDGVFSNSVVQWVRDCCRCPDSNAAVLERLRSEYDLSLFSQELVKTAKTKDLGQIEFAEHAFACNLAYCGVAQEREHLAACATRMIREQAKSDPAPAMLLCFAIIQDSTVIRATGLPSLSEGQRIQVAIRATHPDVPVAAVAKAISKLGGGRQGMAAALVQVPNVLHGRRSPESFLAAAVKMVRGCLSNGIPNEAWQIPERTTQTDTLVLPSSVRPARQHPTPSSGSKA